MRVLACGVDALLVEVADLAAAGRLYSRLRRATPPGVVALVPAARTVLVRFDPARTDLPHLRRHLTTLTPARPDTDPDGSPLSSPDLPDIPVPSDTSTPSDAASDASRDLPTVTVPVHYDGPDLAEVARRTGLTPAQVVERHTRGTHRVAFCGFAPGFAYVSGLDPVLHLPRRDSPRTRVPTGAVAIADQFTGVYPRASPGGWHLIGRTDLPVFDLDRDPPALLPPGTPVRFVAIDAPTPIDVNSAAVARTTRAPASAPAPAPAPAPADGGSAGRLATAGVRQATITVVSPGPLATIQDLGRTGLAHLGITGAGALDRRSLRLANRLVGNQESAAGIEATYGGLDVTFDAPGLIAVTGAPCPLELAGRAIGMYAPVEVRAGARLRVGSPGQGPWTAGSTGPHAAGVRTYLAIRGGLDVPSVLGSCSRDTLAGLGPAPLTAGDVLPLGRPQAAAPLVDLAPQARYLAEPVLRVILGPRDDWFTPDALATLWTSSYEVGADSDRIGIRLRGPALTRRIAGELPSEGMVAGGIQIPPDGQPVVFLADHPVTGGYPVVGVLAPGDLSVAAQCRPGQHIRLRPHRPQL
ncbi:urea amidolyase family protein [Frankia sp. R82]|uniref:5-oxoprolinase subunit B/C family protein n=1 Tax=Frankia sp. R82 TaxID=2950553 RepID=UPI00204362A2|nr:urea amidolyase family protein [Frankia sp. R82]MCM3883623.1 urea amidolyase family protein [Frankia sp. R82]